jgi:hypothetical protein
MKDKVSSSTFVHLGSDQRNTTSTGTTSTRVMRNMRHTSSLATSAHRNRAVVPMAATIDARNKRARLLALLDEALRLTEDFPIGSILRDREQGFNR